MCGVSTLLKIFGTITIMTWAGTASAETMPANGELKKDPLNVTPIILANANTPSPTATETVAVAYAPSGNLRFGIGIKDYSATEEILQLIPSETSEDTVEFNAGFTYPSPHNSNTKFYLNYSMLGASIHPALQDKSSQKDYYMDQQAKLGVQLEF